MISFEAFLANEEVRICKLIISINCRIKALLYIKQAPQSSKETIFVAIGGGGVVNGKRLIYHNYFQLLHERLLYVLYVT